MSVYRLRRPDGSFRSPYFYFSFKLRVAGEAKSRTFQGSTGQKTAAAARKYEDEIRRRAALGQLNSLMTVAQATKRYLEDIEPTSASDEARRYQRLCMAEIERYLGAGQQLTAITQDVISKAATERARTPLMRVKRLTSFVRKRDRLPGSPEPQYAYISTGKLPTPAAVNRQLIEPLRRVLRRAKKQWGVPIDLEQFQWGGRDGVKRKEPDERNRELSAKEEAAFWAKLPKAYADICELYIISGKRQSIWLDLRKEKVDLDGRTITVRLLKKRNVQIVTMDLTQREYEIVAKAYAEAPEDCPYVFTVESERNFEHGAIRHITSQMLRRKVKDACEAANIKDFRPHDFRHTFGSRVMRTTKNIKFVQKAMDHSSIASTLRYINVLQDDITEARASVTTLRNPANWPTKEAAE